MRVDQAAEGLFGGGLLQPVWVGAMELALDAVFAFGRHPADVQAVDADAVAQQGISAVARERGQRTFGGAIGGNKGLPGQRRHRADIDNAARNLVAPHQFDGLLHQKKRSPHIDRHHAVKQRRVGVQQRAPVGDGGGVDQHVHAAKLRIGRGDHLAAIVHFL